jgi:hypothetical protein
MESALVAVAVSVTVVSLAVPAVLLWGLAGAFATLMLASVLPPMALARGLMRSGPVADPELLVDRDAVRAAFKQFHVSVPSITTTAVEAAVHWVCTVYLVRRAFGIEGVGLVAVAMQWWVLMSLAESSWSGVSIKSLAEAVGSQDPLAVRTATFRLLKRHLTVTLAVSAVVLTAAGGIADFYGLGSSGLETLIRLSAGCAVVSAGNKIFEGLLLCLHRQTTWFVFSVVRLSIQLSITVAFIETGLFVVVVGVLAGAIVQMLFCAVSFNRILAGALAARD